MIDRKSLITSSYYVGIVVDRHNDEDIARLIRSIAGQSRVEGVRLGIGIIGPDGRNYDTLIRSTLQAYGNKNWIEVTSIDINQTNNEAARHNLLTDIAIEHGYKRYIGLRSNGFLHHSALFYLAEKWLNCDERSLVEMRVFPREHAKKYDPVTGETEWCVRNCFSISPQYFKTIGGFDDSCGLHFQDVDLSWRLRIEGQKCYIAPNSLYFYDYSDENLSQYQYQYLEMLKSGRILAWKWKNEGFYNEMEKELVELGIEEITTDPVSFSHHQVEKSKVDIASICDFDHGFAFSPVRW